MPRLLAFLLFSFPATALVEATDANYYVVSLVVAGDPYEAAGSKLVDLREAVKISGSIDDLEALLEKLRRVRPEHVAFVVRPEQLDLNLVHQILRLATQVDDDPFVDFSYGFITGRTPEAALRLAQAGVAAEKQQRAPEICVAGVAGGDDLKQSKTTVQHLPLDGFRLKWQSVTVIDPSVNEGQRDTEFIDKMLKQLQGKSMFAFAGHGYPDRVVGGPNWKDIQERDYTGAVVFNIACYTGVTSTWFDSDWKSGKLTARCVQSDESFALGMIDTGLAAYVAYSCSRPAGGEMFADMIALATQGISVGEQRRRHLNSVILTHLGQGFDAVVADQLKDGQPLERTTDTDKIVRKMSAGSVLFGDPAFQPFQETPGAFPIDMSVTESSGEITAVVSVKRHWAIHCSDSLEQTKLRMEARIPMGDKYARAIKIGNLPFGNHNPPRRLSAAMEEHRGDRFLHVKALFDRPIMLELRMFGGNATASFIVETTDDVAESQQRFTAQ